MLTLLDNCDFAVPGTPVTFLYSFTIEKQENVEILYSRSHS